MTNFSAIKQSYREDSLTVLKYLLGEGKVVGKDYVALNPKRNDGKLGSFRIDIATGMFNDFATGDKGWSIIDLAAFVWNCGIVEAANKLIQLFPFLASSSKPSTVIQTLQARKKEIDIEYIWCRSLKKGRHPYLDAKGIQLGNARINYYRERHRLMIPLTNTIPTDCLNIQSLQSIDEVGEKKFLSPSKGLFYVASKYSIKKDTVIVCEGYATAQSIAEATEIYTIACMSSTNMNTTVLKVSQLLPNSKIIIAADNDNAGGKAAEESQQAVNGVSIVYPMHCCNDFNDLYVRHGADVVKTCFMEVLNSKRGYNDR